MAVARLLRERAGRASQRRARWRARRRCRLDLGTVQFGNAGHRHGRGLLRLVSLLVWAIVPSLD